jgi:hypothetical protein
MRKSTRKRRRKHCPLRMGEKSNPGFLLCVCVVCVWCVFFCVWGVCVCVRCLCVCACGVCVYDVCLCGMCVCDVCLCGMCVCDVCCVCVVSV